MKTQLSQSIGIKAKAEKVLDLLIEILIELKDFTVFHKITFGETILFGLTAFRAVWYVLFGVTNNNFDYYFSETVWTVIFVCCGVIHTFSFFLKTIYLRIVIILTYAFIWAFLGFLAAFAKTSAPAVPTFTVFTFASIFLAVRLWHENK